MNFQKYLTTANTFVEEVAEELGIEDRDKARRVVRCTLQALRARLTPEQSLHFIAQLPMLLKAVYVDGWKLGRTPDLAIRSVEDFVEEMMRIDHRMAAVDFPSHTMATKAAEAVFTVVARHVSPGELEDVERELPRPIRKLLRRAAS